MAPPTAAFPCLSRKLSALLAPLPMGWHVVPQANPGHPIFNLRVVFGRYQHWMIEAAYRDIHFVGVRSSQERQRRAALRTKGAKSARPPQFPRLPGGEPKLVPTKRGPGYERRP